jgi:transcriptional regulator with XRE-family HTH domain
MTRARVLSDEDVARLRAMHEIGWSLAALGEKFGISHQHASRVVRGEQRASIGPV